MAALIVKTTDGNDIRRYTARADQMTYASLHKRVAEAFQTTSAFKIQYKDDEGDEITMTCDEELAEAISLALKIEPAVLRLKIVKTAKDAPPPPPPAAPAAEPAAASAAPAPGGAPRAGVPLAALMANIAQQLPALVQQLPEAVRHMIPNAELDIDATVAATKAAAAAAAGAASQTCAAANAAFGANPASAAFASAAAGAANTAASCTASAADVAAAALKSGLEGFHPGVSCDRSGMCPIVGNRYHLNGHDYDLCEEEYAKLRDDEKALYSTVPPPRHRYRRSADAAVHHGVTCDKSGACPIVGVRYHLPGRNYDLCQAEFDKLEPHEQAAFQRIQRPCKFNGMPIPGRGPMGMGRCGERNKCRVAARFVQDMSIHDGTQMAPGTKFTKIWRLKNVGEVPWPWGAILLRVGGDAIGGPDWAPIKHDGSLVEPGQEVDVAVDMTAPADNGRYIGYWRLSGPWGRRKFGQRVWCHIQVVDPASPPQAPTDAEMMIGTSPRGEATDDDDEASLPGGDAGADADADADGADADADAGGTSRMDTDGPAAGLPACEIGPNYRKATTMFGTAAEVAAAIAATPDGGDGGGWAAAAAPSAADASASRAGDKEAAAKESEEEKVTAALVAMGFSDRALIKNVIAKVGLDVEACAHELVSFSEWDVMLSDLEEMGFNDRERNQKLLAENSGSIKKTVKTLVSDSA